MNYFEQITKQRAGEPTDGRYARSRVAQRIGFRLRYGPHGDSRITGLLRQHSEMTARIDKDPTKAEELMDKFNAVIAAYKNESDRY